MARGHGILIRGVSSARRLAALPLLLSLALLGSLGRAAHAQDAVDPSGGAMPPPPPAAAMAPMAPAPPPASAPPVSENGSVERLPATAYPEPYTRGLYGGSLWSTFHGLQWPYYPRTGIGISGYAWLDNSYEKINYGDPAATQRYTKEYLQQGRLLLRVTPTYSNDVWFVQAQAELVANKDQTQTQPATGIADTDNLWVRAGQWQKWDVMVGRFEGFEVYHLGMGLDLNTEERRGAFDGTNTPPDLYGASYLFYRPGSSGNIAFHLYPDRSLRIEVLSQVGSIGGLNGIGGRPALIYDKGWFKFKVAGEYQWLKARGQGDGTEKRNRGFGGTVQFVLPAGIEFGANGGYAIIDTFDNNGTPQTGTSGNTTSFGGFANARLVEDLLLGLGANYVKFENLHTNVLNGTNDQSTNLQTFVALQYLVKKQLFVKLVGAYAKSHFYKAFATTAPIDDNMTSVRLRVMYLF